MSGTSGAFGDRHSEGTYSDFTQRSMVIAHATGNGRGVFQLMELFLDYLQDALNIDKDVSEGFVWGNEITCLTPPAAF